jgi:predicted nucleotidyltransferase
MGGSAARGPSKYDSDVDVAKVVTVNQWAQWRGAKLIWINYPQKSRLADSESTAN